MAWMVGEIPHIQNDDFLSPGYLPICSTTECGSGIADPETRTRVAYSFERLRTKDDDDSTNLSIHVDTVLSDGHMFAAARNAVLGLKGFNKPQENEPFLNAIPARVRSAATVCALAIRDGGCSKFVEENGAIRPRRSSRISVTPVNED